MKNGSQPRKKEKKVMKMNRRDFVRYSIGMGATVLVGGGISRFLVNPAFAAAQNLDITITDAMKDMVTDNPGNPAKCYFWVYKMKADGVDIRAEVPGPSIFITKGDTVTVKITNELDEHHAFAIPGIFDSETIAPGGIPPIQDAPNNTITATIDTTNARSGAHLYYDNLNQPVNRVMGLHGAFIVMPTDPSGAKFTPYDLADVTAGVQKLFDDFGSSAHYPGLAWDQYDNNTASYAPAKRTYIWLVHQASPKLFADVGAWPAGQDYPAQQFMDKFLRDPFNPIHDPLHPELSNNIPIYFTINGQSGHYSHNYPHCTPNCRAGEPCVIHILNAGLWTHSMHLHANHFYVTFDSKKGGVQENPLWIDVYNVEPMDMIDYVIPYMRPPDVPNKRGIGNPDILSGKDVPLISVRGNPVWPPYEEMAMFIPKQGTKAGIVDISVQLSPLCYPMHDHSEPSQTAQGGNYNLGLISGINFIGDRNIPGGVKTFPNPPNYYPPNATGPAGGT